MTDSEYGGHRAQGRAGRPRRADVEETALRATVELIAEHGYTGTTIDRIARRTALAKTTLYRRWESKGEMAVAALAAALGSPPAGDGPARAGVEATIGWLAEKAGDPSLRLLMVGLTGEAARDADVRARLRAQIREPFTQQLSARWDLPRARVDLAFDVVVGTLLHRMAMTGRLRRSDVAAVTELAVSLLFEE